MRTLLDRIVKLIMSLGWILQREGLVREYQNTYDEILNVVNDIKEVKDELEEEDD